MHKRFNVNKLSGAELNKVSEISSFIRNKIGNNVMENDNLDERIRMIHTKDVPSFKKRYGEKAFNAWIDYHVNKEEYEVCAELIKEKSPRY